MIETTLLSSLSRNSAGFNILIGADPNGYKPRVPVLFHPPEGTKVLSTYENNGTRFPERECFYCEKIFAVVDSLRRSVPCMCCSLRCSKRMRGISDPPPRVVASLKRWHPQTELTEEMKEEVAEVIAEVPKDG